MYSITFVMQLLDSLHIYKLLSLAAHTVAHPPGVEAGSRLDYAPLQAWMRAAQDIVLCFEVNDRTSFLWQNVLSPFYCCVVTWIGSS